MVDVAALHHQVTDTARLGALGQCVQERPCRLSLPVVMASREGLTLFQYQADAV